MALEEMKRKFREFQKQAFSQRVMNKIANKSVDIIFKRTKSGFGVTRNKQSKKRLKKLSLAYIRQRRGVVQFTTSDGQKVKFKIKPKKLGQFGTVGKSNLTLSGLMLDNIRARAATGRITLDVAPTPRPNEDLNNKELAELVSKDRPFLALTNGEKRIIVAEYKKIINAIAKKIF